MRNLRGGAGQGRAVQDMAGQDRTGQDRTGQDRTGQDRTGQDRTVAKLKQKMASGRDRRKGRREGRGLVAEAGRQ